jgi:hypothetical protein
MERSERRGFWAKALTVAVVATSVGCTPQVGEIVVKGVGSGPASVANPPAATVAGRTISGIVTFAGQTQSGSTVTVSRLGLGNVVETVATATTDAKGVFSANLPGAASGDLLYRIDASVGKLKISTLVTAFQSKAGFQVRQTLADASPDQAPSLAITENMLLTEYSSLITEQLWPKLRDLAERSKSPDQAALIATQYVAQVNTMAAQLQGSIDATENGRKLRDFVHKAANNEDFWPEFREFLAPLGNVLSPLDYLLDKLTQDVTGAPPVDASVEVPTAVPVKGTPVSSGGGSGGSGGGFPISPDSFGFLGGGAGGDVRPLWKFTQDDNQASVVEFKFNLQVFRDIPISAFVIQNDKGEALHPAEMSYIDHSNGKYQMYRGMIPGTGGTYTVYVRFGSCKAGYDAGNLTWTLTIGGMPQALEGNVQGVFDVPSQEACRNATLQYGGSGPCGPVYPGDFTYISGKGGGSLYPINQLFGGDDRTEVAHVRLNLMANRDIPVSAFTLANRNGEILYPYSLYILDLANNNKRWVPDQMAVPQKATAQTIAVLFASATAPYVMDGQEWQLNIGGQPTPLNVQFWGTFSQPARTLDYYSCGPNRGFGDNNFTPVAGGRVQPVGTPITKYANQYIKRQ